MRIYFEVQNSIRNGHVPGHKLCLVFVPLQLLLSSDSCIATQPHVSRGLSYALFSPQPLFVVLYQVCVCARYPSFHVFPSFFPCFSPPFFPRLHREPGLAFVCPAHYPLSVLVAVATWRTKYTREGRTHHIMAGRCDLRVRREREIRERERARDTDGVHPIQSRGENILLSPCILLIMEKGQSGPQAKKRTITPLKTKTHTHRKMGN